MNEYTIQAIHGIFIVGLIWIMSLGFVLLMRQV